MPVTTTHTFGPGSLEDVKLKSWVAKRHGDGRKIVVTVKGSFRVYCGYGWEHTVPVDIRDGAWTTEAGQWTEDIVAAHSGDTDAAWKLTDVLIQMLLDEAWSDPCVDEQELL